MKDDTSLSRIVLDQKPREMLYEERYKLLNWDTLQHRRSENTCTVTTLVEC